MRRRIAVESFQGMGTSVTAPHLEVCTSLAAPFTWAGSTVVSLFRGNVARGRKFRRSHASISVEHRNGLPGLAGRRKARRPSGSLSECGVTTSTRRQPYGRQLCEQGAASAPLRLSRRVEFAVPTEPKMASCRGCPNPRSSRRYELARCLQANRPARSEGSRGHSNAANPTVPALGRSGRQLSRRRCCCRPSCPDRSRSRGLSRIRSRSPELQDFPPPPPPPGSFGGPAIAPPVKPAASATVKSVMNQRRIFIPTPPLIDAASRPVGTR